MKPYFNLQKVNWKNGFYKVFELSTFVRLFWKRFPRLPISCILKAFDKALLKLLSTGIKLA